ncbi:MAG: electron transfer flavoprotein subunit alpha/FixB family protein [Hyphomicrobium sp.]|jgi:electron transfer flavoprotein alpha subunit
MNQIKRVDPRRPVYVTPAGLPRIVLGETGSSDPAGSAERVPAARDGAKPLRARRIPERWLMAVVHSDRGSLDGPARQAIAAAAILATAETGVVAVVLGELSEDLGPAGADRVVVLPDLDAARFQPERELAAVSAVIAAYGPEHVFLPDTLKGEGDLGRRLIVAHSESSATHVVEVGAQHAAVTWACGGQLARTRLPRFVLLEAGVVDAKLPFVGAGEIDAATFDVVAVDACQDEGLEDIDLAEISLVEADFIVGAGNGVRNVGTLGALARSLGAAVGASRVAVDAGLYPRDKQIGATGKTVTANAYVAVGISGAVQHLQGIKDCRHVIAINRDAGAPIVKRADLTLIGDAEELMQAVIERIAQARLQRELPVQS